MIVYVDELPKDDCPCNRDGRCRLLQKECYVCYFEMEKNEHCPLQSLADYTKQVRKEVCEELKAKAIKNYTLEHRVYTYCIEPHILDQIQGEKVE